MAKKGIKEQKRRLLGTFGPVCQGCRKDFPPEKLTIDHIQPLSKGGHPRAILNLQLLCEPCNHAKSDTWDGISGWALADCSNGRPYPHLPSDVLTRSFRV